MQNAKLRSSIFSWKPTEICLDLGLVASDPSVDNVNEDREAVALPSTFVLDVGHTVVPVCQILNKTFLCGNDSAHKM